MIRKTLKATLAYTLLVVLLSTTAEPIPAAGQANNPVSAPRSAVLPPIDCNPATQTCSGGSSGADPGVTFGTPRASTNDALKALAYPGFARIRRDGFHTPGDGGTMEYTWSPANCPLADDGAQVQPARRTGCWIADSAFKFTPKTFGAKGDGKQDDGPAIRAACAYGAAKRIAVSVPRGQYVMRTLDPSGLGAIVMGTGTGSYYEFSPACDFIAESWGQHPDAAYIEGPTFTLGANLNRPLLYIHRNTKTPMLAGMTLSGNRTAQTGWPDGLFGLLYVVQLERDQTGGLESGLRLDNTVIRDGYDGALLLGPGRGNLWCKDSWFQYSGKTPESVSVFLAGYDSMFNNCLVGNNTGTGIYIAQGSQYQFLGGAVFLNGGEGMKIYGYTVQHVYVTGINFQANGREGLRVLPNPPYPGTQAGQHSFSQLVFEGNSANESGRYSDIRIDANVITNLNQIGFNGRTQTSGQFGKSLPKYNIELGAKSRVFVTSPSFGTGSANTQGFTNACSQLISNANVTCRWTPTLKGDAKAGEPTYGAQFGSMVRYGNQVTVTFTLDATRLGQFDGSALTIGGLPVASTSTPGDFGSCTFSSVSGWTGPASYATLSGTVPPGSDTIHMIKNGSGKGAVAAAATEFKEGMRIVGSCHYLADQ